jgi:hypothetical protein
MFRVKRVSAFSVSGRPSFAKSSRLLSALVLALAVVPGCAGQSPVSPTSDQPIVSGYVYQQMIPGSGEPPIADAVITVRDAHGTESTASSDRRGFYQIEATVGEVVVTATKDGYTTRESRFDVTDDTVLNFSLAPLLP